MKKLAGLLIALCLISGAAQAATTFQSYWKTINIMDFGCDPTGVADSTDCIQAAIDAAYAANLTTTYCPPGIYKITRSLFLDPPHNLRGIGGAAPVAAYNAGTTYADGDVARHLGVPWLSLANGNVGNTPSTGSAQWRLYWNPNAPDIHFSMAFVGPDGGFANYEGATPGCTIRPTFNNGVAFWVGTGNGMSVKSIQIHSQAGGYRGENSEYGRCIAVAGGPGGANRGLVQDIWCDGFYIAFETGTNSDALGAEIEFNRVLFSNCFIGVHYARTQNDINHVTNSDNGGCTTAVRGGSGRPVSVWGGNMSTSGVAGMFTVSSTSALTAAACAQNANVTCYTFTTTIASPDTHIGIGKAYNSYMLKTANFGVVPLELTAWNSGTSVATFRAHFVWSAYYFQTGFNAKADTDLEAEIQAVTTLFATERVTAFSGPSFHVAGGPWMENASACTTFVKSTANGSNGNRGSLIETVSFNYDPAMTHDAGNPAVARYAYFLCQQSFPFIDIESGGGNVVFDTVSFNQGQGAVQNPVVIDIDGTSNFLRVIFRGQQRSELWNPVIRSIGVYLYGGSGGTFTGGNTTYNTPGFGGGEWEQSPFMPTNSAASGGQLQNGWNNGAGFGPFLGYRPAPYSTPRIPPSVFTTLQSITGANALGSYPLANGGTLYSLLDPFTGADASGKILAKSAHKGFSYGQDLTTTNVDPDLEWSAKGQSFVVHVDPDTMSWMFPGLGIKLNTSANTNYIVTGTYPSFGWITVLNATQNGAPTLTAGTKTTTYTGTLIGQDAYSWTTYP